MRRQRYGPTGQAPGAHRWKDAFVTVEPDQEIVEKPRQMTHAHRMDTWPIDSRDDKTVPTPW
jgi:hypothetical protein